MVDELNSVVAGRYALTKRPRSALNAQQRKLWLECKREENQKTKGRSGRWVRGGAKEGQLDENGAGGVGKEKVWVETRHVRQSRIYDPRRSLD